MKWVVMIISQSIAGHVAYLGKDGPLASDYECALVFDDYSDAAERSISLVRFLSPLEITQVRIISEKFTKEGA